LTVVCEFLGKDPREARTLVDEDGLCVVSVPGKRRPVRKVLVSQLYRWVCEHSEGLPPSLEDFQGDLREFISGRKTEGGVK